MEKSLAKHRSMDYRKIAHVLAASLILTLLNAIKPIHIDDNVFFCYAVQITEHPLAPYDFELTWTHVPEPAHNPIVPLVVPYWQAVAIRLFGDSVFWWKIWFLPINALMVWSLYSIFRRFARGLEVPLLWMTTFSPIILPGVNLMLDVPELGFALFALNTFFTACDRRSTGLAILAGLSCSLAIGTKWTGFLAVATIATYSVLYFRPKEGAIATILAVGLFAGWEGYIALQSGKSHFLYQLQRGNPSELVDRQIKLPLVMILGALTPAVTILGMAALGLSRRVLAVTAVLFVAGYGLVAINPSLGPILGSMHNPMTGRSQVPKISTPVFLVMGLVIFLTAALVVWRLWGRWVRHLLRRSRRVDPYFAVTGKRPNLAVRHLLRRSRRVDLFLVAWLLIELAGYFAFSPFPAARRVIGVYLVMTILAGRLASRTCRSPQRAALVGYAAVFSVAFGALYYVVDLREAMADKELASEAVSWIRERDPKTIIHYSGNFEYYAKRLDMHPLIPDRSHAKAGDWLVVKMKDLDEHLVYPLEKKDVRLEKSFSFGDMIPLTTVSHYYIGSRPIGHLEGPRARILIFRFSHDFDPTRVEGGKLWDTRPIPFSPARWTDPDPVSIP